MSQSDATPSANTTLPFCNGETPRSNLRFAWDVKGRVGKREFEGEDSMLQKNNIKIQRHKHLRLFSDLFLSIADSPYSTELCPGKHNGKID